MGRLELDQLRDVGLVFDRPWVLTILNETVSSQILKGVLHESYGIFVVELVEEKLVHLKELIPLNILDLLLTTYMLQL